MSRELHSLLDSIATPEELNAVLVRLIKIARERADKAKQPNLILFWGMSRRLLEGVKNELKNS